jgi:hypothetical protein
MPFKSSGVFLHAMEADLLCDAAQVAAEFAVHRVPNMVIAGEGEADPENPAGLVLRRQQVDRQEIHFERAGDRLRDHRGVLAEHAVGIEGDVEPAAALLLDFRDCLAAADAHRVAVGQRRAAFIGEFRRLAAPGEEGGGGDRGRGGNAGARQQGSARYTHSVSSPLVFCRRRSRPCCR